MVSHQPAYEYPYEYKTIITHIHSIPSFTEWLTCFSTVQMLIKVSAGNNRRALALAGYQDIMCTEGQEIVTPLTLYQQLRTTATIDSR